MSILTNIILVLVGIVFTLLSLMFIDLAEDAWKARSRLLALFYLIAYFIVFQPVYYIAHHFHFFA